MKRISAILMIVPFLLFISGITFSQSAGGKVRTSVIEPYPIKITVNKTTNIIFPYAIKSVDRGSADVLAQKARGVENILLVKAGKENFPETNLSVITADGKLYSFLLDYINNPAAINISFVSDTINNKVPASLEPIYTEANFEMDAEKILTEKKRMHGIRDDRYEIKFYLHGIYIKNDIIFFKLEIANNSNINYDINMLSFFIKDEKKSRRTASQEILIQPLYVSGNTSTIKGKAKNIIIYALPKFTTPDRKYLSLQLIEENGGRNLKLSVPNRAIIKAKLIN